MLCSLSPVNPWSNKSWFVHLSVDIELFPLWGYCEQGCSVYLSKVFAEFMLIKFWYPPDKHLRVELLGYRVCACVCSHTQSSLTFWDPMDCSLWVSSVHGAFQARILEQVAISFSRGSSWLRELNSCLLHLMLWQVDSLSLCHLGWK